MYKIGLAMELKIEKNRPEREINLHNLDVLKQHILVAYLASNFNGVIYHWILKIPGKDKDP